MISTIETVRPPALTACDFAGIRQELAALLAGEGFDIAVAADPPFAEGPTGLPTHGCEVESQQADLSIKRTARHERPYKTDGIS
ncbi:hypothetical protein [Brevundimonas nasdae]|uniref:Uncharacterized protein n=1 Tax=Brevundimonas nasdae TaxID=172043 RepID=A0ABX8TN60_9CAUL|nr:hypothetical protein [Brevundimonas nasdae]QYC10664.1 hypothetical protein KWG56_01180 [Brevundimonas nasdae]QYC13451.1 hypothetical protein KWG63_14735 [Brevundimonas nasdae]